jgi:hypothetical protein
VVSKAPLVTFAVLAVGSLGGYALWPDSHSSSHNERCSNDFALKVLASAQADFHSNDRDNNDVADYWRKDVAGLYTITDAKGVMIRLIELSTALADERPASDLSALGPRAPKNGFWLRAILHEGDDPAKPDRQRFAFAAIPVDPKDDTFIVDENNSVFRTKLPPGQKLTVFPRDLTGWSKLD